MPLPANLRKKFSARLDELIRGGAALPFERGKYSDWPQAGPFTEWKVKSLTILSQVYTGSSQAATLAEFRELAVDESQLQRGIGILRAAKDDLDNDFLSDLQTKVEAEVASDYMGQAERLLKEGQTGKYDHVPAAVLAGAVLEKGLRLMCDKQQPPISVIKPNGEPKAMMALVDELKKAGAFNELKATQLRAWAHVRNKAAHGEFDQFSRQDVENMLGGIPGFLADHIS